MLGLWEYSKGVLILQSEGPYGNITQLSVFSRTYLFFICFCLVGMSHEGIFRISGNHKVVESLKATYDKGDVIIRPYLL